MTGVTRGCNKNEVHSAVHDDVGPNLSNPPVLNDFHEAAISGKGGEDEGKCMALKIVSSLFDRLIPDVGRLGFH